MPKFNRFPKQSFRSKHSSKYNKPASLATLKTVNKLWNYTLAVLCLFTNTFLLTVFIKTIKIFEPMLTLCIKNVKYSVAALLFWESGTVYTINYKGKLH